MIACIEKTRGTSASVLDYNEEKVSDGNAEVVGYSNLPDDNIAVIYDTFEQMESNPAIAAQVRKKSFHLTLNPGPMDRIYGDDRACLEVIRETMERMGYGEQPYVIYRHHDIDRVHYHVVSTRVRRNGKMIDAGNEARKLQVIMRELGQKHGFVMGTDIKQLQQSELPVVQTKEFSPKDGNVLVSLRTLFEDALRFDFHSLYQFQCVMLSMNVMAVPRKRRDGSEYFVLQGLKDNGKKGSRVYCLEKNLEFPAADLYRKRLEQNNEMGVLKMDRKVAMREISDYCLENTASASEYCSALEETGIRHVLMRDEKTDQIRRVVLVEKNTYSLVDSSVRGELFLKAFRDAESSGRWAPPPPKSRRPLPGAKTLDRTKPLFFGIERSMALRERIVSAIEAFKGISKKVGGGGRKIGKP